MKDLLARALEAARLAGAGFAEARIVRTRRQSIEVKNGLPTVVDSESAGLGVRAFVMSGSGGLSAGFSSSSALDRVEAVGEDLRRVGDVLAPAPKLSSWRFTGVTGE